MSNKVTICGVDTSKLPVLTADEKRELWVKIKNGDIQARQKFINGNLRLVLSIIKKFSNRAEMPDDLFQIGCIGLIKAIDNFDLSHGVQFSTYAVPMIVGEIRRFLRDNNYIRVSRSVRDIAFRALGTKEKFISENNREPSVSEIAKILELTPEEVANALDSICDPISLFDPLFQDGDQKGYVMDHVRDDKNTDERWIEEIALTSAIKTLNPREKHILNLRFYEGKTQMEVADEIGISQAQVSRLEKSALKEIKKHVTQ